MGCAASRSRNRVGGRPRRAGASGTTSRGPAHKDAQMRRNTHRIGHIQPVQRCAKHRDVAIGGIGEHGGDRQSCCPRAPHQRQRQAPLFLEADRRRRVDALAAGAIARPLLRQVQRRTQDPGAPFGPQQGRRGHLAIGDLAQGAAILPRHANGVRALFREARVVDHEHPFAHGPQLLQPTPHRLPVPRRVGDEMLKRLIVPRIVDPRQHRLHRFPGAVSQQSLQISAQRRAL